MLLGEIECGWLKRTFGSVNLRVSRPALTFPNHPQIGILRKSDERISNEP
jgi:hypothetical protein